MVPKIITSEERARRWAENAKKNEERKLSYKEKTRIKNQKAREEGKVYTVRVRKDSKICEFTDKAAANLGIQPGTYLRIALVEKLKRDGYMLENVDKEPID